jgi:hypothetical protein
MQLALRRRSFRCLSALATVFVVASAQPSYALTDDEIACRDTISKYMGKYAKAVNKAIAGCHKLRNKGTLSSNYDCNDPVAADLKFKAAKAQSAAFNAITSQCPAAPSVLGAFPRCPAPYQFDDDGGATTEMDTFGELYLCLVEHTREVTSTNAARVLGEPGLLDDAQQKCHGTLAKGYNKVVDTIIKERSACQKDIDKNGGSLDFVCAAYDGKGKIAGALAKSFDKITGACSAAELGAAELSDLDSCSDDLNDLPNCALADVAMKAGGGMGAMYWEFPGECPTSGSYDILTTTSATDVDVGPTGSVQDMDPVLGYGGARYTIACDLDCANCATTSVSPAVDACRCNGNASIGCSINADCASFGGTCNCFYGPPAAWSAGGSSVCVQTHITAPMSGDLEPGSGDFALSIPIAARIFLGNGIFDPCPTCESGVCDGGARNGSSCSVDATDPTFGDVSYDCPPNLAQNISGSGIKTTIAYTTGTLSLPFALPCDGSLSGMNCACNTCTLDNQRACNTDAECSSAGAGTCRTGVGHGGYFRAPNQCGDLICSPDPNGDPNEGTCLNGPTDKFCDNALRANGEGLITCLDNADCAALNSECPGGNCGTCTLSQDRDCFLDPIVAEGEPGLRVVGQNCLAPSTNAGVNAAIGLPGAYRIQQNISPKIFCDDGITPFELPGGSNCP